MVAKFLLGNDADVLIWGGLWGNERWRNSEELEKFCNLPHFFILEMAINYKYIYIAIKIKPA